MFDRICREHGIEHRLTKPNHPWTNGQVERMNRTLKEATVRRYHYETHRQLREHLAAFLDAYNFAKRLKTLRGLTPYEQSARPGQTSQSRFGLLSWRRQFRRKLNLRQTRSERGISAQAPAKISRWAFRGLLFCCSRVSNDA